MSSQVADAKAKKTANLDWTKILSYAGLVALVVIFWLVLGSQFIAWDNVSSIIDQAFTVLMMGLGATFVFGFGGTNLAVNAGLGMCAMFMALAYQITGIPAASIPAAILSGVVLMFLVGGFIAVTDMNPFVCTMCFNYVFSGILQTAVATEPITTPTEFTAVVDTPVFKLVTMVVCTALAWYVLNRTRAGKSIKAMGGNPICSAQSGVNLGAFKVTAFILSGITIGIAAFFYAVRVNAISSYAGNGSSMEIIVMAVLGGLSLAGGAKTRTSAVVVGAFSIAVLQNGLVRIGLAADMIQMVKGIAFLLIVYFTYERASDFVYT